MIKNLPVMQEMRVQTLFKEDPLVKGMATYSSILAWKSPWTDEPARLQAVWLQKVGHDSVSECNSLPRTLAVCREG